MSNQVIFTFDSTILNAFQSCPRKMEYNFVNHVQPITKAEALESGDLMHKMLEVYYYMQTSSQKLSPFMKELAQVGLQPPKSRAFFEVQDFSTIVGRWHSTKLSLPSDEIEETIFQFKEYTNYYQHDEWNPLAVEEVGSKTLYEDENVKIIYNFKIDLIAEKGKVIAPFDHKTARRREEPSSMSNQFIGYCYGLGLNNIVVNKIGFQKTLSPQQRFNRFILTVDDARIEEWKQNTIWWAFQMIRANETSHYPMNLTSCDKYSGCIYRPICETDPESRLYKIERNFKIGEAWDVAKELEK